MKNRTLKLLSAVALTFFSVRVICAAGYATDVATIIQAQDQALDQARAMLEKTEKPAIKEDLENAIKEMERAKSMLNDAKKNPEKLTGAVAAEQAAYQDFLKTVSHDFSVSRGGKGSGGQAGQPGNRQMDQLELTSEDNRYETERQATAAPTQQQHEQSQIADKLKQLAQRQQDLNDRLKELQTALAEAKSDQEREDIERQLKRLSDEEKQMLADVDDLRQQMDQSPNSDQMSKARQQLDQTRSDTQRASQELQDKSVSQALAAGTRAQEGMKNLQENLRNQASSQFTQQMHQLRSEARDLASKEEDIGTKLESLENPDRKSLDDSAERQQLVKQMAQQESALTNLLGQMQNVSEQAETSEPLLSQQLYDALRRSSQMHNDNLFQTGQDLLDHGLVTQAAGAESAARKNINELRDKVERAAESVLGNESDSLHYAQKELDDLAAQLEKEARATGTNSAATGTNAFGRGQQASNKNSDRQQSLTNMAGGAGQLGQTNGVQGEQVRESANGQGQQQGESAGGRGQQGQQASNGQSEQGREAGNGQGQRQRESADSQGHQGQQSADGQGQQGNEASNSQRQQGREGANGQSEQSGESPNGQGRQAASGQGDANQNDTSETASGNNGAGNDKDRLRQAAREFGGARTTRSGGAGGLGVDSPITGNDFVQWSDRMRNVEQVIDSPELRNRLASVREHVAAFRAEYRERKQKPDPTLMRAEVLDPLAEVRTRLDEELARLANVKSLVPLDHDPVPENYSEMVRKYYEKLGGGQ